MALLQVFAYGSNLCADRMRFRVPSARVMSRAHLVGHALRFHKRSTDKSGKADAFATGVSSDRIEGIVYELASEHLPRLDRAEGAGAGYDRLERDVVFPGGAQHRVLVYIAERKAIDSSLSPYSWYLRLVVEGAKSHALPGAYVSAIEVIPATDDPDRDRDASERAWRCL